MALDYRHKQVARKKACHDLMIAENVNDGWWL